MPLVDVVGIAGPFAGREATSPLSGERGLIVHIEVLEEGESLGTVVLGDAIEIATDDGKRYVVIGRRATFGFVLTRRSFAVACAPAEIVPLLQRSRGGRLYAREHVVRAGDRLRLRAHFDDDGALRDDLAPFRLDEAM